MNEDILHIEDDDVRWCEKHGRYHKGHTLHMRDGSRWFHPYNGEAPIKLTGDDDVNPKA